MLPIVLAHGTLGPFDEILAVAALGIFLIMIIAPPVITAIRRNLENNTADANIENSSLTDGIEPVPVSEAASTNVPTNPTSPTPKVAPKNSTNKSGVDHFQLD